MKIVVSIILLLFIFLSAMSVYADAYSVIQDASYILDATSPANGDNLALIVTVLCLSALALVVLLIVSTIIKRHK